MWNCGSELRDECLGEGKAETLQGETPENQRQPTEACVRQRGSTHTHSGVCPVRPHVTPPSPFCCLLLDLPLWRDSSVDTCPSCMSGSPFPWSCNLSISLLPQPSLEPLALSSVSYL